MTAAGSDGQQEREAVCATCGVALHDGPECHRCGEIDRHARWCEHRSGAQQRERQGVTQTLLAGRKDGVPGNCVQAAVATMLELPIEAVPHFLLWDEDWNLMLVNWLARRGWLMRCRDVDTIPDERCIVGGTSPRGISHVCIGEGGRVFWDPHPSRGGLVEVDEAWFLERAS